MQRDDGSSAGGKNHKRASKQKKTLNKNGSKMPTTGVHVV